MGVDAADSEIKVFLIADTPLLRDEMVRQLEKSGELRVVGSSPAVGLAWQEVAATCPKVVLAECSALEGTFELLEDLSSNLPGNPLVIFGIYEDLNLFLTLVSLRVSGYALKGASVDELIGLVRKVAKNDFPPCQVLERVDSESYALRPGASASARERGRSVEPHVDIPVFRVDDFFSDC